MSYSTTLTPPLGTDPSQSNLSAAGFGALTWNAAPASPPREELVPAAATVLAVTSILPQTDGPAVLTARLTSAIDVAFDGSADVHGRSPDRAGDPGITRSRHLDCGKRSIRPMTNGDAGLSHAAQI